MNCSLVLRRILLPLIIVFAIQLNANSQSNSITHQSNSITHVAYIDSINHDENKDSIFRCISASLIYTLSSDEQISRKPATVSMVYPTLVLNNIIITDTTIVNYIRNNYFQLKSKGLIIKDKLISQDKAKRRGINNVHRDGAIILRTRRGYYIDPREKIM